MWNRGKYLIDCKREHGGVFTFCPSSNWEEMNPDQFWPLFTVSWNLIKHLGKICLIGRPPKRRSRRLNVLRGMESSRSAVTNDWHSVVPAPPPPPLSAVDWTVARGQGISRNPCVTREALTKMSTLQRNLTPSTVYSRHTLPPAFGLVTGSRLKRKEDAAL